jgi:hypothetical protein
VVALALGVVVLVSAADHLALVTLTAFYWLGASLLMLRWAGENLPARRSASSVAGTIGIVVAVLTLVSDAVARADVQQLLQYLLGLTAILTGMLRVVDVFHDGVPSVSHRVILGIIETGLGVALVTGGETAGSLAIAMGLWGVAGGTFLVLDALMLRDIRERPVATRNHPNGMM